VEVGHVTITVNGSNEVQLRARVENRGGAVPASKLRFSAWSASGEGVWSAWYDAIPIAPRSRRTVTMTWQPGDVPPGSLTYGFTVSDSSTGTDYVTAIAADRILLRR
jgi:hypothetical protein